MRRGRRSEFLDLPIFHFRVMKTSAAVFVTMLISHLIGIERILFPALASALCIKPTFFGGLKEGGREIRITLVSAFFTAGIAEFVFAFLPHSTLLAFAVTAISAGIMTAYCMKTSNYGEVPIALVTVLFIGTETSEIAGLAPYLTRAVVRLSSIIIGIAVAEVVNGLFVGAQYRRFFRKRIKEVTSRLYSAFIKASEAFENEDPSAMQKVVSAMDNFLGYLYLIEERIEYVRRESKLRGGIRHLPTEMIGALKEIMDCWIRSAHHISNIASASSILLDCRGGESDPSGFERTREVIIEMKGIISEKFKRIAAAVEKLDSGLLAEAEGSVISELEILFHEMEGLIEGSHDHGLGDLILEYLSIARNLRDLGRNLELVKDPLGIYIARGLSPPR